MRENVPDSTKLEIHLTQIYPHKPIEKRKFKVVVTPIFPSGDPEITKNSMTYSAAELLARTFNINKRDPKVKVEIREVENLINPNNKKNDRSKTLLQALRIRNIWRKFL